MDPSHLDELQRTLASKGPEAAIEQLCTALRSQKDYANLFYALLLKKRHALGVSPVPTEGANELPESVHVPYEEAIREAGRLVGQLYLDEGDIPHAWMYYRMLGETEPVAKALERYRFKEEEDPQQLIEIAFHHGVNPRKGFDWILERYGICSTITTVKSGGKRFRSAIAFTGDGHTLLTAGRGGEIKLWDATTLQAIRTIPNASRSWIEALAGLRKLVASAA